VNFCTRTLEAQHESVDDGKSAGPASVRR